MFWKYLGFCLALLAQLPLGVAYRKGNKTNGVGRWARRAAVALIWSIPLRWAIGGGAPAKFLGFFLFFGTFFAGSRLVVVGLTGGIATGKSTASDYLRSEKSVEVIDADAIAREVVVPGTWAYKKLVSHFGECILHEDTREVDRSKLRTVAFASESSRRRLNVITHSAILVEMFRRLIDARWSSCPKSIAIDAPLLYETKVFAWLCYPIFVTTAPRDARIARLKAKEPQMSQEQITAWFDQVERSQMSSDEKERRADGILLNDGTVADFYLRIDHMWDTYHCHQ